MNARERFHAVMHIYPADRCPIMDFGFWQETRVIWDKYGLPKDANSDAFFGMDPQWSHCGAGLQLCPGFETKVLQDKGATEVVRDSEGVTLERGKFLGTIPHYIDHSLKDRETWEKDYKPRMRPDDPRRFPAPEVWKKRVAEWTRPDRDYPLFIGGGSYYGTARNWFGLERISQLLYEDRKLIEEIVETFADVAVYVLEKTLSAGVRPEAASMWEDICYNSGPLISPAMFKQIVIPQTRRVVDVLHKYGTDVIFLDCDGKIDALAPLWLEAGVNTMFPIEVGTWKADVYEFRRRYGKEMRLIGGFDKRILAGPLAGITREVERLADFVEEGGFIPLPDHRVPADVPLKNYLFYIAEAKRVWGHNLPNLKPTGKLDPNAPLANSDQYSWHTE